MFKTIPLYVFVCLLGFINVSHAETLVGSLSGEAGVSSSGAATYQIPIDVPPGINGLQPNLALRYNSQQGNGLLGLGWQLTGLSEITRCAANQAQDGFIKAVDFTNDRFCLDGEKLKVVSGSYGAVGAEYRTETNPQVKIFTFDGVSGNPGSWQVIQLNGHVFTYGDSSNSKLLANGTYAGKTVKWGLGSIQDSSNNQVNYSYINDQANGGLSVSSISYNAYRVDMAYEGRSDVSTSYEAGSVSKITQRLSSIAINTTSYDFDYQDDNFTNTSMLLGITYCSDTECYPKTVFDYNSQDLADVSGFTKAKSANHIGGWGNGRQYLTMDVNGDGLMDIAEIYNYASGMAGTTTWISDGAGGFAKAKSANHIGGWGNGRQYLTMDVNGDGLMDITEVYNNGGSAATTTWVSDGAGGFAKAKSANHIGGWGNGRQYLTMDVNGDGLMDIAEIYSYASGMAGTTTWISDGAGGFAKAKSANHIGGWGNGRQYLTMDVNGDGLMDITEVYNNGGSAATTTWVSDGAGGFAKA
ncbi:SpvB/TcaC N-terminal domain-containing protein, partial [Marinomonas transparens]